MRVEDGASNSDDSEMGGGGALGVGEVDWGGGGVRGVDSGRSTITRHLRYKD